MILRVSKYLGGSILLATLWPRPCSIGSWLFHYRYRARQMQQKEVDKNEAREAGKDGRSVYVMRGACVAKFSEQRLRLRR